MSMVELVAETGDFCDILQTIPKFIESIVIEFDVKYVGITGLDPSGASVTRIVMNESCNFKSYHISKDFDKEKEKKKEEKEQQQDDEITRLYDIERPKNIEEPRVDQVKTNITVLMTAINSSAKIGQKYKSTNKTLSDESSWKKAKREITGNNEVHLSTDFSKSLLFDFKRNGGSMNKEIKIDLMDPEDPLPLPDKHEHYYHVKMDAKEFDKLIRDSKGSILQFTLKKGFMSVSSEDEFGTPITDKFRNSDQICVTSNPEINPEDEEITVSFSNSMMKSFTSPQSITNFVYLEFHKIKALRVAYYINNSKKAGFIEHYLAASLSINN